MRRVERAYLILYRTTNSGGTIVPKRAVEGKAIKPTRGPLPEAFGIARGDVAGTALVKTKLREETKSGSQAFLAMTALFGR